MMFKIVAILLFVGAQAQVTTVTTTPATTVTTTPAPTGTTTPQYTGTTTPGSSNSVAMLKATEFEDPGVVVPVYCGVVVPVGAGVVVTVVAGVVVTVVTWAWAPTKSKIATILNII